MKKISTTVMKGIKSFLLLPFVAAAAAATYFTSVITEGIKTTLSVITEIIKICVYYIHRFYNWPNKFGLITDIIFAITAIIAVITAIIFILIIVSLIVVKIMGLFFCLVPSANW